MVTWENIDAHLVTFRQSTQAQEFRGVLGDFFEGAPTVEHFELVPESR
jgi:hypothetical protein